MSTSDNSRMAERIQRASLRLARLQAHNALKEMRDAKMARAKERRQHAQRGRAFAQALADAGLGDWSAEEVAGLLLTGRDRFGDSETARKLFRQRAEQHLNPPSPPVS